MRVNGRFGKLALIGMFLVLSLSILITGCSNSLKQASEDFDDSAYREFEYDALLRNPEKYIGTKVKVTGEMMEYLGVEADVPEGSFLVEDYTGSQYGDASAYIMGWYICFEQPNSNRILASDIVTFYGKFNGLCEYNTMFGETYSDPIMVADYYTVNDTSN